MLKLQRQHIQHPSHVFKSENVLERGFSCSKLSDVIRATDGFYIVSFSDHLMHIVCKNDNLIVWFCESDLYLMLELKSIRFDKITFPHCL